MRRNVLYQFSASELWCDALLCWYLTGSHLTWTGSSRASWWMVSTTFGILQILLYSPPSLFSSNGCALTNAHVLPYLRVALSAESLYCTSPTTLLVPFASPKAILLSLSANLIMLCTDLSRHSKVLFGNMQQRRVLESHHGLMRSYVIIYYLVCGYVHRIFWEVRLQKVEHS